MKTNFYSKERFAVLICLSSLFFCFQGCLISCKFFIIVSESATLPIAASSKLCNIFTQLSLIFRGWRFRFPSVWGIVGLVRYLWGLCLKLLWLKRFPFILHWWLCDLFRQLLELEVGLWGKGWQRTWPEIERGTVCEKHSCLFLIRKLLLRLLRIQLINGRLSGKRKLPVFFWYF